MQKGIFTGRGWENDEDLKGKLVENLKTAMDVHHQMKAIDELPLAQRDMNARAELGKQLLFDHPLVWIAYEIMTMDEGHATWSHLIAHGRESAGVICYSRTLFLARKLLEKRGGTHPWLDLDQMQSIHDSKEDQYTKTTLNEIFGEARDIPLSLLLDGESDESREIIELFDDPDIISQWREWERSSRGKWNGYKRII